jgi:multisubunit Na+/H+ antiporter MnhB subunit
MAPHRTRILAVTLGLLSAAGLAFVWVVVSAPVRWDLRYPGGGFSGLLTVIAYIGMSVVAGRWGSRKWYALTVIAVLTFVYVGFFIRSPYWNQ